MPIILPAAAKNARKQTRVLKPSRADRRVWGNYYRAMQDQVDYLNAQTANLSDLVSAGAQRSTVADALLAMTTEARERAAKLAPQLASQFVDQLDTGQKRAFESSVARALGVDFAHVLDNPAVAADLAMAKDANAALVRSISDEHLFKVGSAVLDNYRGKPLPDNLSLMGYLKTLGAQTDNRAYLIARDQTNKLTGALGQSRQESIGIEEYIWRIIDDSRVVGKPGGKYPTPTKLHGDHYHRNGKTFKWSEPPEDGHPGQAIQCRCYGEPVLNLAKLKAQFV